MESHISETRRLFALILREEQCNRYWYYGVLLPTTNSNSLSWFLQMNDDKYTFLLKVLGLAKIVNKPKIQIQIMKNKWEEFIQLSNLCKLYFDKYNCCRIPTNGIDAKKPYIRYQGFWIGFGIHNSNELTNPST